MDGNQIRTIAIAGGGIVAWSAAAALRRRLPAVAVTVISTASPPDALADRIPGTLPSIVDFHEDIGLTEEDTVVRAGSSFRLGTRFEEWVEGEGEYTHAYGPYGDTLGPAAFHQLWLRAREGGNSAPFEAHSPAAVMAGHGGFIHPHVASGSPLATIGYGLHIQPGRYRQMMRAYALHLGATELDGAVGGVRLREDGFIDAIEVARGAAVTADLFVDASGPQALVRRSLEVDWEDWSAWLRADRLLIATSAPGSDLPLLDRAIAVPAGWRWVSRGLAGSEHGLAYSSAHLKDDDAARLLAQEAEAEPEQPVPVRAGRLSEPWLRNCVAIGDAAVAVEPLEWTNLHLAHNAIDRIIAMIPDRDCSPVELGDYNRQASAEADRVRDFLILHYATAQRSSEPFWVEASTMEVPPSLAHTLTQFRERGRLPFYEEETFSRDSWLAVLLGQRVYPRRIDPLVDAVPEDEAEGVMARIRNAIAANVQRLPPHGEYLRSLARSATR